MKTYLLAGILFAAPIVGVITVNPEGARECVKDAQAWFNKTFPKPKPKKKPERRRG